MADKTDPWAPAIIELQFPITYKSETVHTVQMRQPTGADMKQYAAFDSAEDSDEYISIAYAIDRPVDFIELMHAKDILAVGNALRSLLPAGPS